MKLDKDVSQHGLREETLKFMNAKATPEATFACLLTRDKTKNVFKDE